MLTIATESDGLAHLMDMTFTHRVDRSLLVSEPCGGLRRLGSRYDGGYVVAIDTIRSASRLLSFGVARNWDFERDARAANPFLAIDAYDPSVGPRRFATMALRSGVSVPLRFATLDWRGAGKSFDHARTAIDYFRFFSGKTRHISRRVWYNDDRGSAAIADIVERAAHGGPQSVFAKIDIEGSEYRILPWIIESADLFTGLVVEFHHTDICAELFNAQLRQLRETFRIVHVHGNNYGDLAVDGSLPLTLEITFVHRRAKLVTTDGPSAEQLDAPNDPNRPDMVLHHATADAALGDVVDRPRAAS